MPLPKYAFDFENTAIPYTGSLSTTIVGTGITYPSGKYRRCIDIPNSGGFQNRVDYGYSGSYSVDAGFSVAFWVKPYTTSGYFMQFYGSAQSDGFGGGPHVTIVITNSGGKASVTHYNFQTGVAGTGYNVRTAASTLSTTTFTHIAAVFGNGVITLYVNGVAEPIATYLQNGMTLNSFFRLGSADSWGPASAQYDDLRIFDRALTSANVQSIYNQQGVSGRGVQNISTYTPTPIATLFGTTFSPLNVRTPAPDTSVAGQTTFTSAAGNYSDQGSIALTPLTTGLTVTIKFKLNTINVNGGIFCLLNNLNTNFYQLYLNFAQKASVEMTTDSTSIGGATSGVINTGTIYTFTIVMQNNGYVYLYLDGVLYYSSTTLVTLVNRSYNIYIARERYGGMQSSLTVYDFRVINETLTSDKVLNLYKATTYNILTPKLSITGTPLFTQLSPAATSSAVGAFSLRAVNGTSARAVQVRRVPSTAGTNAIQFSIIGNQFSRPDISATPPNTSVAGQVTYNGTTQDTQAYPLNLTPATTGMTISLNFKLNSAAASQYILKMYPTTATQGTVQIYYNGTSLVFEGFSGSSGGYYNIGQYSATSGVNYYIVMIFTGTTIYTYIDNVLWRTATLAQSLVNDTSYRLGSLGSYGGGGYTSMTVYDFRIMNTVLTASNIVATDFYADRLGNLLTAPVVGQTLANWLGGATGYIRTWYDQSGKGNDAIQTTAVNQPIIQRATKGPGYMVVFNGTSQFVTLSASYNFLNGTNITVNAVALRTATVSRPNYIIGTNSPTVNYQRFFLGFASDTSISMPVTSAPTSITIPAYNASNEPVTYMSGGLKPSRVLYQNDALGGTNTNVGTLSVPSGYSYSIGYTVGAATYYYQGNLFELLIFTSALDQTQVTQVYQNQLGTYGT
jgi:hypothetical protein